MSSEGVGVGIDEIAVLKIFDGDPTEEEMAELEPVEQITVKNGIIVEHLVRGEVQ